VEIVIACKFQTDFVQLHRDLGSSKGFQPNTAKPAPSIDLNQC
jgi:hypothetical protein